MTSLDALLGSVTVQTFLGEHFEKTPLRLESQDADRFKSLISIETIDQLLRAQPFYSDDIDMARADPKIQRSQFIMDNGQADKGAMARAYQEGATLILPQLNRRVPTLATFCRQLESIFSAHLQTNIYLTPGEAQGFQTHYDNHCVFILQVEGTKRWRLYDSPAGVPYRGERFTPGQFAPGQPTDEFLLTPGDVLYIPRGLMHDAISEPGDASLHITTGIITKTWADFVLEAVSEAALKSDVLRQALPAGYHKESFDRSDVKDQLQAALDEVARTTDPDAVLDLFIDNFIRGRQPDLAGALSNNQIQASDQFTRRGDIPLRLAEADEKHLALVAPGGDIMIDRDAEPGLDTLLAGQPIRLSSFSPLSEDKARQILERLLAFGVVERI